MTDPTTPSRAAWDQLLSECNNDGEMYIVRLMELIDSRLSALERAAAPVWQTRPPLRFEPDDALERDARGAGEPGYTQERDYARGHADGEAKGRREERERIAGELDTMRRNWGSAPVGVANPELRKYIDALRSTPTDAKGGGRG